MKKMQDKRNRNNCNTGQYKENRLKHIRSRNHSIRKK